MITMDPFPIGSLDWRAAGGFLILLGLLALAFLIGPVVLVLAWLLQRWAAAESWHARDRWASIGGFALVFGIIALICLSSLVLPIPLLAVGLSSLWHHFPLLGESPLSTLIVRWMAALPLAPALTIGLEVVQPRTVWYPGRKLTAREQAQRDSHAEAAKAAMFAGPVQSTTDPPRTPPHRSKTQEQEQRSRREGTTPHHSQPVPQERRRTPPPAPAPKPKARAQKKPMRQPEPPAAPTYDWNTGEGSLKDL